MELNVYKNLYQKQLNGPEDDYWKNGVIKNKPHILLENGYIVTEENILYEFYFDTENDLEREKLLLSVIDKYKIKEIISPTYSKQAFQLVEKVVKDSEIISYCYEGKFDYYETQLSYVTVNYDNLHIAVDYTLKTLGGNEDHTRNYYADLIAQNGLYLVYDGEHLVGTGEIRYEPPYGYVGMTVDLNARNQGYGTSIIREMKNKVFNNNMIPLCGVDSNNIASIKAIEKAGFIRTHNIHKFLVFS